MKNEIVYLNCQISWAYFAVFFDEIDHFFSQNSSASCCPQWRHSFQNFAHEFWTRGLYLRHPRDQSRIFNNTFEKDYCKDAKICQTWPRSSRRENHNQKKAMSILLFYFLRLQSYMFEFWLFKEKSVKNSFFRLKLLRLKFFFPWWVLCFYLF